MSDYDAFPYLNLLYEQGGSDMYFSVGAVPQMKVEGISRSIGKQALPPLICAANGLSADDTKTNYRL